MIVSEGIELGIIFRIVEFIVEVVEFVGVGRKAKGGEGLREGLGAGRGGDDGVDEVGGGDEGVDGWRGEGVGKSERCDERMDVA